MFLILVTFLGFANGIIVYSKITGSENRADWSKFKGLKVKPMDLLKSLGMAVILFLLFYRILPIFNRIVYKRTGNVYAGALLWCMIFIMMSLSASISFVPM